MFRFKFNLFVSGDTFASGRVTQEFVLKREKKILKKYRINFLKKTILLGSYLYFCLTCFSRRNSLLLTFHTFPFRSIFPFVKSQIARFMSVSSSGTQNWSDRSTKLIINFLSIFVHAHTRFTRNCKECFPFFFLFALTVRTRCLSDDSDRTCNTRITSLFLVCYVRLLIFVFHFWVFFSLFVFLLFICA